MVNLHPDYSAKKGALLVFFAFLVYYIATAMALPYGSGPDYDAHFDGARFIYTEGRLAILPEDAPKLHITAYGSTRALRPPLSYLVAAGAAHLLSWTEIELRILFRAGSALLCALTLGLIFAALNRYLNNQWLAVGGVLLIGLLPQFVFIASHLNDDSAAIFSVTFLIYCLIRLLRGPVDPTLALLTGTAIGLVLLSKFTAWVFLPIAGVVLVLFARPPAGQWLLSITLVSVGIMLGGGWWIGFNIWHYGWADPLLFNIGETISTQYLSVDPGHIRSFAKEGISLADLILRNYNHFLDETLVASIGNLDWLRLRLGFPQYLLYTTVLMIGAVYVPIRWIGVLLATVRGTRVGDLKKLLFESLLFLAVVLQFAAYTLYEWNKEIQIQGKYLLPILMCPILLFFACVDKINASRVFRRWRPLLVFGSILGAVRISILPVIAISIVFAVHIDGLRRFVIPYYDPPAKVLGLGEGFRQLDLTTATSILDTENIELSIDESGWNIRTTNNDGQIHFAPSVCKYFQTNNLLKINMHSDGPGILQFFWSDGGRFVDQLGLSSMTTNFEPGENSLVLPVGIGDCKRLRLDPTNVSGQSILLRSFSIAPLTIIRWPYYFRIFSSSADSS